MPSSLEAEQFLAAVIAATPAAVTRPESSWNMAGSTTSVNSLSEGGLGSITTPTLSRRNNNPFSKAMEGFGTLTRSSGEYFKDFVKPFLIYYSTSSQP